MIAVLASGSGSNFEALAQRFPQYVSVLLCNVEKAGVIEKARQFHIPTFVIPHKNYSTRAAHEQQMIKKLAQFPNLKLVVLAGYMRVLSPEFFSDKTFWAGKTILNLHPAHLEDYKGAHAYEYAVENKYPRWGLSIHHVTPELDSGALMNSCEVTVLPYESAMNLHNRVRATEHNLLLTTVENILKKIEDKYVKSNL